MDDPISLMSKEEWIEFVAGAFDISIEHLLQQEYLCFHFDEIEDENTIKKMLTNYQYRFFVDSNCNCGCGNGRYLGVYDIPVAGLIISVMRLLKG